jgi:class 3 adenylate cyclase
VGAGAGVHAGPVVEGVLGGERQCAYDFIGDTVNTAQRLCDAAAAGEVLVSQQALGADPAPQVPWREIQAKGKRAPVRALAIAPGP